MPQFKDVFIIGAGPIGLELAAALKAADVDYVHVDAGQVGQTISWYPQQARFFSSPERIAICGVPIASESQEKTSREQYLSYLRSIVQQLGLKVNTYERVTAIQRRGESFMVHTRRADGTRVYHARRVVVAIGDMHSPRKLGIPGEDLPHVSHYFTEPHRYFQQKLLIVGGRNSAVEAALRCYRAGAHVTISYRHAEFDAKSVKYWLLPELNALVRHGRIGFHPSTTPTRITATHVTLESREVEADFVLLLTGYVMDASLLEQAGVELEGENRSPRFNVSTMETSVPNLYVAGTAAAGTQNRFRLFIENCHVHVTRIVRAITGRDPAIPVNAAEKDFALPES